MCSTDIFLGLIAILFPPLPVWVKCGLCSADSIINILLCVLGYLPGLLHSWYIIAKFPDPPYEYESLSHHDHEGGRVAYVYVRSPPLQPHPQPSPAGPNYGSTQTHTLSPPQAPQEQGVDHGEGGSGAPPPSYAQVIAGDHKIQTRD